MIQCDRFFSSLRKFVINAICIGSGLVLLYLSAAALLSTCDMNMENEVSENIKRESRRYAKRQLTWLRRDENIRWIEVDGLDIEHFFNNLSECIEEFLYV